MDPYEYATTTGPRKAWNDADTPPEVEPSDPNQNAWFSDPTRGREGEGWERFDYHEESYWRRLKKLEGDSL